MPSNAREMTEETKYYAFALSMTRDARPALRAKILDRLADAVADEEKLRARCRDTDVAAATRIRPWRLDALRSSF